MSRENPAVAVGWDRRPQRKVVDIPLVLQNSKKVVIKVETKPFLTRSGGFYERSRVVFEGLCQCYFDFWCVVEDFGGWWCLHNLVCFLSTCLLHLPLDPDRVLVPQKRRWRPLNVTFFAFHQELLTTNTENANNHQSFHGLRTNDQIVRVGKRKK